MIDDRSRRTKVLVLSRSYPNRVQPLLGIWVQQMVAATAAYAEARVISPAPWCPPLPRLPEHFAAFRGIERSGEHDGVEVLHPRFVVGPGSTLVRFEAASYLASVLPAVARMRRAFPFELVHAHFTYPDGVVAAILGKLFRVPVVVTEQAPWRPWLEQDGVVRRQAVWAARQARFQVAISTAVKDSIEHFTGALENLVVVPDAVDGSVFTLPANGRPRTRNRILFVGAVRPVKGLDILLEAVRLLEQRGRDVELVVIGEGHFDRYRREQARLERLSHELGLSGRVRFVGRKPVSELVGAMQESAALVLPSRAESLGMVLVEALACGTPVVATRCGGPEDIVTPEVGVLVPPEDPAALADGITSVLDGGDRYEPAVLRAHALERFGEDVVGARVAELYRSALRSRR